MVGAYRHGKWSSASILSRSLGCSSSGYSNPFPPWPIHSFYELINGSGESITEKWSRHHHGGIPSPCGSPLHINLLPQLRSACLGSLIPGRVDDSYDRDSARTTPWACQFKTCLLHSPVLKGLPSGLTIQTILMMGLPVLSPIWSQHHDMVIITIQFTTPITHILNYNDHEEMPPFANLWAAERQTVNLE